MTARHGKCRDGITFLRDDVAFTVRVKREQRTPILSVATRAVFKCVCFVGVETPADLFILCITYKSGDSGCDILLSREDEPCLRVVDWEEGCLHFKVSPTDGRKPKIVPNGRNSVGNISQDAANDDSDFA